MTLNPDRRYLENSEEADALRAARRVSVLGSLGALVLGFGLISLLIYGPLSETGVSELTATAPMTVPHVPTPEAPAP
jgi:hypothetical protein